MKKLILMLTPHFSGVGFYIFFRYKSSNYFVRIFITKDFSNIFSLEPLTGHFLL